MRKLFWALFVVGCGFNVHGVEKTVKTRIVEPTSVEQATNMFFKASSTGNEKLIDYLLVQAGDNPHVTDDGVQQAFDWAAEYGDTHIMKQLLNFKDGRWLTTCGVQQAFVVAACSKRKDVMKWLFKKVKDERKVTSETVGNALKWAAEYGDRASLKYLIKQDHTGIDNKDLLNAFKDLPDAFDCLVSKNMSSKSMILKGLKNFAKIHFPKEMYEDSVLSKKLDQLRKTLSAHLDQHPVYQNEWKEIMATITKGNRNSPFAEYLLDSFIKGKEWISKDGVNTLMLNQYYQDAMALMKLRQKGATKVSELPVGVFRCVLEGYCQPRITQPSITNMGVQGNQEESEGEDETEEYGGRIFWTSGGRVRIRPPLQYGGVYM